MRYEVVTNNQNYVMVIHHTGNSKRDNVELDLSQYDLTNHRLHAYKLGKDELIFDNARYQEILKEIDNIAKSKEIAELQAKLDNSDYICAWTTEELLDCTTIIQMVKVFAEIKKRYKETIANRKVWRKRIQELKGE